MPVGCSIIEFEQGVDFEGLTKKLENYERSWDHEFVNKTLLTDITEVEQTEMGVEFVLRYDRPFQVGSRPEESGWRKETVNARIRLARDVMSDVGILIGSKKKRGRSVSELARLLDKDMDEVKVADLKPKTITKILGDDSLDANFGWWKDIDSSTESASVTGDIEQSTHARNISDKGEPTWVVFISEYSGEKVGISTDSIVFYGSNWETKDMEDYIRDVVATHR